MRILDAKLTLKNRASAALRLSICLLLLLLIVVPVRVLADPPAVHDDYYLNEGDIWEDSDDSDNILDVLANDEPLPGIPFTIAGVIPGEHGLVQVIADDTLVTYQPNPDYFGLDEFTYNVEDNAGNILSATVYILVSDINDPPVADDDTAATDEDESVVIDVLNNDSDIDSELDRASLLIFGPNHGRTVVDKDTGLVTYIPDDDWHGQDTFIYQVCDDEPQQSRLCTQANVDITVDPVSDPPIADAGPDQSAPTLSKVTLDGSGSYDPDGPIELSYEWRQIPGTQLVALSDPTAQSPTFIAPDDPEVLVFELTVYDEGQSSINTDNKTYVTITNQTPVANAGADQRVQTEELVTLDGSASYDPDHDLLTFEWIQTEGPTVLLSSTTAESPTFTAPASAASLTFALRVRDEYDALSAQDQTKVYVHETPIYNLHLPLALSNYVTLPDLVIKAVSASRNSIQVVIENQGNGAVTQGFYVDVYVDPRRAPISANEGWDTPGVSSGRGLVWAIEVAQTPKPSQGIIAPLMPGDSLTLNVNDAFYRPDYSSMTWPLAAGTPLYAQVDTFPATSPHDGLVLETHEYYNQTYNNIAGPVYSTSAAGSTIAPMSHPWSESRLTGLLPRQ